MTDSNTKVAQTRSPDVTLDVSKTLMVANLIATLLVVGIHYRSSPLPSEPYSNWSFLAQEFLLNGIARVAVPFFAVVAGHFLAGALDSAGGYRRVLKKRLRTLLIPYALGSALILLVGLLIGTPTTDRTESVYEVIRALIASPPSIQYWFLRDLMVLTVLSPLMLFSQRRISVLICSVAGLLWLLDIQPFPRVADYYVLNIETLFFFVLGGVLSRSRDIIGATASASKRVVLLFVVMWIILVTVRIFLDPGFSIWYAKTRPSLHALLCYKFSIALGVICLVQISYRARNNPLLVYLSGHTFFVYLYHLQPLKSLVVQIAPPFIFAFPIALLVVFAVAELMSRGTPRIYEWLTGGRSPATSEARTRSCQ